MLLNSCHRRQCIGDSIHPSQPGLPTICGTVLLHGIFQTANSSQEQIKTKKRQEGYCAQATSRQQTKDEQNPEPNGRQTETFVHAVKRTAAEKAFDSPNSRRQSWAVLSGSESANMEDQILMQNHRAHREPGCPILHRCRANVFSLYRKSMNSQCCTDICLWL